MKTLTILFESPNVFKVLPEWPEKPPLYFTHYVCNGQVAETGQRASELYREACEQSKANAIRIENYQLLPCKWWLNGGPADRKSKRIRSGDIFQVEGFEYEIDRRWKDVGEDKSAPETIAILKLAKPKCELCGGLGYIVKDEFQKQAPECPICFPSEGAKIKLAKEEEPKRHKPLREHFEVDTDAGICLDTFRYIDALEKYIEFILNVIAHRKA